MYVLHVLHQTEQLVAMAMGSEPDILDGHKSREQPAYYVF